MEQLPKKTYLKKCPGCENDVQCWEEENGRLWVLAHFSEYPEPCRCTCLQKQGA